MVAAPPPPLPPSARQPSSASPFSGMPDSASSTRCAPSTPGSTSPRAARTCPPSPHRLAARRTGRTRRTVQRGSGIRRPAGRARLRRAVADWLARSRGIAVAPDGVLIVAGIAQALTLLHPVLRADGITAVAVEEPGSLGTRQHLAHGGLSTPPVPVDAHGPDVTALRATGAPPSSSPAHQFPTGVVTSGERRRELLRWAADGGLILEDDYDAEHRYDRPPVPALRSQLTDRLCYMGSVSKLLAPALRIGWLLRPGGTWRR